MQKNVGEAEVFMGIAVNRPEEKTDKSSALISLVPL